MRVSNFQSLAMSASGWSLSAAACGFWPAPRSIFPHWPGSPRSRCSSPWIGRQTYRQALFLGWWAGVVETAGGFYWLIDVMQRFADFPWIAAALVFVVFCAARALIFLLFTAIVCGIRRRRRVPMTLLAPIVMAGCELVVPQLFPCGQWITQAWHPLVIQITELTGPFGVTALLMMVNGALYDALVSPRAARYPLGCGGRGAGGGVDFRRGAHATDRRAARACAATQDRAGPAEFHLLHQRSVLARGGACGSWRPCRTKRAGSSRRGRSWWCGAKEAIRWRCRATSAPTSPRSRRP